MFVVIIKIAEILKNVNIEHNFFLFGFIFLACSVECPECLLNIIKFSSNCPVVDLADFLLTYGHCTFIN